MSAVCLPFAPVAPASRARQSSPRSHRGSRSTSISASVVTPSVVYASSTLRRKRSSCTAHQVAQLRRTHHAQRPDVRAFAENDGRGPNPNDVDGPVAFGGEMVGVGIFLLIAFQFFVLAFVDFPIQSR